MTVEHIPLDRIKPNPWQPRTAEDRDHILMLAESIQAHGLLQVPSGRRTGDQVELAFGHSRHAAYLHLWQTSGDKRWAAFPVNIVALDDRQMADAAAQENVSRKDLSAIEIARAIQRYIESFQVTQLEAGKVYGYASQSSVSNLLRLLELPEAVQHHVAAGELPERYARDMVALTKLDPKACVTAAAAIVKDIADGDISDVSVKHEIAEAMEKVLGKAGRSMRGMQWDLAWPGKPIAVTDAKPGEPAQVPACKGCPHYHKLDYNQYCLQPACYAAKDRIHAQHEVQRISKKWDIAVASDAEKKPGHVVFKGEWSEEALARAALALKHPSLRVAGVLAPPKGGYDYNDTRREEVLGSKRVVLISTDPDVLRAAVKKAQPKAVEGFERDNRYKEEQRKQREALKRAEGMVRVAARHMAATLQQHPGIVTLIGDAFASSFDSVKRKEYDAAASAAKAEILMVTLLQRRAQISSWNTPNLKAVAAKCEEAAKLIGVRLPAGWADAPEPAPKAKTNGTPAKRGQAQAKPTKRGGK